MVKNISLGNDAIMFGHPKCPGCIAQHEMVDRHFSNKKQCKIKYYDLSKHKVPEMLLSPNGDYTMPTWYLPTGNGKGVLHKKIINSPEKFSLLIIKSKNNFGDTVPQIGTLAKNGKSFADGQGFNVGSSFANDMKIKWGDASNSGTLGREFGPGKFDSIYSNDYYNNLRMAVPGGDLDTALSLNRRCNTTPAIDKTTGLITDSENPQITNFGKRRNRFGPANRTRDILLPTDIVLGGATQFPSNREYKIKGVKFISSAPAYMNATPRSANSFGLKSKPKKKIKSVVTVKKGNVKIKPGSVITIKKGKIKIK